VQRMHPFDAGLAALADRDHAEPPGVRPVEQVADELTITLLEDMQRQDHARVEHRAEWEQRQHLARRPRLAHTTTVRPGRPRLYRQDDLPADVAAGQLPVGVLDLGEREGPGDRHLELALGDQPGELGQYARAGPGRAALGL